MTFQYPGAEEPALSGVSFAARPGEVTAIIGGTGSGKSTLAGLIPGFYDVNEGRVLVDGIDVRELLQKDLRAKIGFVPQKAVLFSGTIAENIRYGRENASDEDVQEAAKIAQATEFVDCLPDRLDSVIAQGPTSPVARSNVWRLPAPWCGDRKSTCSTTASRRSTLPLMPDYAQLSRKNAPARRSSSSPSGSAP